MIDADNPLFGERLNSELIQSIRDGKIVYFERYADGYLLQYMSEREWHHHVAPVVESSLNENIEEGRVKMREKTIVASSIAEERNRKILAARGAMENRAIQAARFPAINQVGTGVIDLSGKASDGCGLLCLTYKK